MFSILSQNLSNIVEVGGLSHEGGSDEVNVLLDSKLNQVLLVLGSQSWKINDDSWQVHVLSLSEFASVFADNFDRISHDFLDFTGKTSISNEDFLSNLDGCAETFVRASNLGVVSLKGIVSGDDQFLVLDEFDCLVVLQHSSSDFRSLGVEHDGARLSWSLLQSLSQVGNRSSVGLVVSMREVQSGNVKSSIEHLYKHFSVPAGWSESANDLGLSGFSLGFGEDLVE